MPKGSGVVAELNDLAVRVVDRAFDKVGKWEPLELPQLSRLAATHFPELWQEKATRPAAVEAVLRAAITRLPAGEPFVETATLGLQTALCMLYNLDAPELGVRKTPVEYLSIEQKQPYSVLKARVFTLVLPKNVHDDSAVRRRLTKVRQWLARVLLDPEFPFTGPPPLRPEKGNQGDEPAGGEVAPVLADRFVAREGYEEQIRARREAGQRLCWLYGDAGTGKSRLARAAHRDIVSEVRVPVLHAGERGRLEQDLAILIADSGTHASEINTANVWASFRTLLSKDEAPQVIVFDDLPTDPDNDVLDLIGEHPRTVVMVTSRQSPPSKHAGAGLRVGELEPDELADMLTSRLPDVGEDERVLLARMLGGRPLAIEHSCAFLRETGLGVAEYREALAAEPDATLQAAGEQYGRTLTAAYQLAVKELSGSFDVLRALDLLVFTAPSAMTSDMLAEAWTEALDLPAAMREPDQLDAEYVRSSSLWTAAWPGVTTIEPTRLPRIGGLALVKLRAAVRRLDEFGLVRTEGGLLVMHQLTRDILRSLRAGQADGIHARLIRSVYDMVVAENWQGGEALSVFRMGWALHLRNALRTAGQDLNTLVTLPTDELIRLATLAAVVLRAHRQAGRPVRDLFPEVAPFYVAVSVREQLRNTEVPDEAALRKAHLDVATEVIEWLVLNHGFDLSIDSFPKRGAEPTGAQRWLANNVRLCYHTEWELTHHVADPKAREQVAEDAFEKTKAPNAGITTLREAGATAMAAAACAYDQARWADAVDLLERAYTTYLRIGANVEAIRGAMDAARRLARTHLRAGDLDQASAWLARAITEVHQPRCQAKFNGKRSPFVLFDALLEAQLRQASVEIELTRAVLDWDRPDSDARPEAAEEFARARFDAANQAISLFSRIGARRLVPEATLHTARLKGLTGDQDDHQPVQRLVEWFTTAGLTYQADLLKVQLATISVPAFATWATVPDDELREVLDDQPDAIKNYARMVRDARPTLGDEHYAMARTIAATHRNRYWYARGLAAALILGAAAGRDPAWVNGVRGELEHAATTIGRTDWIDKADGYGQTNSGLWLLAY